MLLTVAAIILFSLLICRFKNAVSKLMIVMALMFTAGILICFFAAIFKKDSTAVLYIAIMLLSVTAYPPEYSSWLEYIRDHNNLEGLKALPTFYAADHCLGTAGVSILTASLLALIFTSFIGNITALSRLFMTLGKDDILPRGISRLNKHGVPGRAILLIAGISALIPLLGRTAIGWIVDVTTFGATIVYGYVSAVAAKRAVKHCDKPE